MFGKVSGKWLSVLGIVVLLAGAGTAWADTKVLGGVPNFEPQAAPPEDPKPPMGQDAFVAQFAGDQVPAMGAGAPLSGVPEYIWWHGCSPTAGGMMVGFWDGKPGFGSLYDGDAAVWGGSGASGTKSMVAGTAHITAGSENGYTYGDWHNSASYPNHQANPNCLADFMKTVDGGSYTSNIVSGLEAYVEWDNPATAVNESYPATTTLDEVPYYGGSYDFNDLKAEIDAGRPVLLDIVTIPVKDGSLAGHSVVAYGYQDNMFTLQEPGSGATVTVGGFAVMDTWSNGTAQSEWVSPSFTLVNPVIDGNGVEWWPFLPFSGWSWVYSDYSPGPYDWMVVEGITLEVVPEPMTVSVLALGGLLTLLRRRRR